MTVINEQGIGFVVIRGRRITIIWSGRGFVTAKGPDLSDSEEMSRSERGMPWRQGMAACEARLVRRLRRAAPRG